MIAGITLLVFLVGMWLYPAIWASMVRPKLKVHLVIDENIVDHGDDVHLRCVIVNQSRLPCPEIKCLFELSDNLRGNDAEHPTFAQFSTSLGGRKRVTATIRVKAVQRGIGRVIQTHITLRDGLALRSFHSSVPVISTSVIVRPKKVHTNEIPIQMNSLMGELRVRRFYNEDPSLLQGIRPYQSGDPIKYISWMTTARMQQLMVKEFGYTTSTRCLIALSGDVLSRNSRAVFERLCECATSIAAQLLETGFQVGVLTNALNVITRDYFEPAGGTLEQLQRIRNRIGSIEPVPLMSFPDFLQLVRRHAQPGEFVIVLSSRLTQTGYYSLTQFAKQMQTVFVYVVGEQLDRGLIPYEVPSFIESL